MGRDRELSKFYAFLAKPLFFRARFVLAALAIPLGLSFFFPLWRIELESPQYPAGLTLDVYAHTIQSGHGGADLRDINILNHYIGMRIIDRHDIGDLDWLPFAIGLVGILALRCAAIGEVRSLVDVVVTTFYAFGFVIVRFVLDVQRYGTELDPDAPVKVQPFHPPLIGSTTVGEITSHGSPQLGAYLLGTFVLGILSVLVVHLVVGRRRAEAGASA